MASASWSVAIDSRRKLLRLSMSGFFQPADVTAFAGDVGAALNRLRPHLRGEAHRSLCDARGMQIQSQDAANAFAHMLAHPVARSKRLAYIVDAALAGMQIRRLTARDDSACFYTVEAAEAWLFEADAPAADPPTT